MRALLAHTYHKVHASTLHPRPSPPFPPTHARTHEHSSLSRYLKLTSLCLPVPRTLSKVEDVANAAKAFAAADESQAAPDFLLSPRSTALSRCGESNVDSDTRSVICGGSEVSCDERHASGMYAARWVRVWGYVFFPEGVWFI